MPCSSANKHMGPALVCTGQRSAWLAQFHRINIEKTALRSNNVPSCTYNTPKGSVAFKRLARVSTTLIQSIELGVGLVIN